MKNEHNGKHFAAALPWAALALAALTWLMSLAYGFQYLVSGNVARHLTYFRIATVPYAALVMVLTWFAVRRAPLPAAFGRGAAWLGLAMVSASWVLTCYFFSSELAPAPWPAVALILPAAGFIAIRQGGPDAGTWVWLASLLALCLFLIPRTPHDAAGDMLQIIDFASADLLRGVSPFQPYLTSSGKEVPFGYWPGVWLPYLPLVALGIDLRVLNLVAFGLIVLLFVRAAGGWNGSGTILALTLFPFMASSQMLQMFLFGHLWVYWLCVCLTLYFVVQRRYALAALLLGICLVTRPTVLFIVAPLAAWVWSRAGLAVLLRSVAIALAVVLAVQLPFVLAYGEAYIANSFGRLVGFGQVLTHFSLAGMLRAAGLQALNLPLQALIAVALFALVAMRRSLPAAQFVMVCGLAYVWEVLFASYATRYVYFPGFLLLILGLVIAQRDGAAARSRAADA